VFLVIELDGEEKRIGHCDFGKDPWQEAPNHARTTPHMFVLNKDHSVAYMGGIDNKPSPNTADIAAATNMVSQALDEILGGKTVTQTEFKAYGCSVKYGS
jgi:hypothetical protein